MILILKIIGISMLVFVLMTFVGVKILLTIFKDDEY